MAWGGGSRLRAPGFPATLALQVACALPAALALGAAISGDPAHGVDAGLAGVLVTAVQSWRRDADYWRLDRRGRLRVLLVARTARPDPDTTITGIARERLLRCAQLNRPAWARLLSIAFVMAVPVAAALRQSPWWLLADLPVIAWVIRSIPQLRLPPPADRLLRLEIAMGLWGHAK